MTDASEEEGGIILTMGSICAGNLMLREDKVETIYMDIL